MFPVSLDILKRSLFVSADSIAAKCEQGQGVADGLRGIRVGNREQDDFFLGLVTEDFRERPDFFP